MINRRGTLVAIGIAACRGVAWLISKRSYGAELVGTVDQSASSDLAGIGTHVYSEEGIPMFLACQNLARTQTEPEPAASALSRKVASAFHRYAEEWQRLHPQAPPTDVSKIIEFIADRDFAAGGTEASL